MTPDPSPESVSIWTTEGSTVLTPCSYACSSWPAYPWAGGAAPGAVEVAAVFVLVASPPPHPATSASAVITAAPHRLMCPTSLLFPAGRRVKRCGAPGDATGGAGGQPPLCVSQCAAKE